MSLKCFQNQTENYLDNAPLLKYDRIILQQDLGTVINYLDESFEENWYNLHKKEKVHDTYLHKKEKVHAREPLNLDMIGNRLLLTELQNIIYKE